MSVPCSHILVKGQKGSVLSSSNKRRNGGEGCGGKSENSARILPIELNIKMPLAAQQYSSLRNTSQKLSKHFCKIKSISPGWSCIWGTKCWLLMRLRCFIFIRKHSLCEWNHNAPIQVIYYKEEECNKCVNLLGLTISYKLTELPRTALQFPIPGWHTHPQLRLLPQKDLEENVGYSPALQNDICKGVRCVK